MKFVIFVLLVVNAVVAGWLYRKGDEYRDMPTAALPPASGVESLRLLSERREVDTSSVSASLEGTHSSPPAQAVVSAPQQVIPASAPEPKTATPPAVPLQAATAARQTQATSPQVMCQTVGPFAERSTVDAFAANLSGLGPKTLVRMTQVEQPSGYWVYLPAMPSADAQRIVADFGAKGVKDYFLGRENFISLGVFADIHSAETRLRAISALGYLPRLEQRFLTREVYWLDVDEIDNALVSQERWAALLAEQPGIQRQPRNCK